ncbi:DUF4238 domain-containing protein [Devosia aquimaris]|uniref:DUF4238 domain-containing protein n=1 Tax=Devosia aquimaris TaxID=2866214 RepID=UPI001CD0EBE7|nr:DUF4238 domain-containing protein [Devosia sp. CJK-A8-3]
MPITRDNHFVPQWYQRQFLVDGRSKLSVLDKSPPTRVLANGRIVQTGRSIEDKAPISAFFEEDLYSTFFGTAVNDEIERKLFGDIDRRGAVAVKAFAAGGETNWHAHFLTFFEYLDIQKVRTPKGLQWLRAQYPQLSQNELMREMQGIRRMNCTIWTEGVREIVSAEEVSTKFLVSDHPVTVYNHAMPPEKFGPHDPAIALKASQTIFPLGPDHCLILTNLEYARDPSVLPLTKRTFPRNYRQSMVNTINFIHKRKLTDLQVAEINLVIKASAKRYVGAGRKEWLHPEQVVTSSWSEIKETLLPPTDQLWHFGGEMYAKFDSGHVHYQDSFGRTEKEREFLKKQVSTTSLKPKDGCGCGSGRRFRDCCDRKPVNLRPTWEEKSIRERNLMLCNGIINVLELDGTRDWASVRRSLTDEKIAEIYSLYEGLWPLETDLLSLLPKPDGTPRAVYAGLIHPNHIANFALGAAPYFGQIIVENPFIHPGIVNDEFNPVKFPSKYRDEFLKAVVFFINVVPFVDAGFINLIPDPCDFDFHLREQMMAMAEIRAQQSKASIDDEPAVRDIMMQDMRRSIEGITPESKLRRDLAEIMPELEQGDVNAAIRYLAEKREADPLASLRNVDPTADRGGQFQLARLAPNFEMAMYIAQATGSHIVTDSEHRWRELKRASRKIMLGMPPLLAELSENLDQSTFSIGYRFEDLADQMCSPTFHGYATIFREASSYLAKVSAGGQPRRQNFEAHLGAKFMKTHASAQASIRKSRPPVTIGKITGLFPFGGIQDNSVNRLLLMSSSENHLPSVPMAFRFSRSVA